MGTTAASGGPATEKDKEIDRDALQAYKDYGNALSIAKKYWPSGPAEVVQAAAATVLIHIKELRRQHHGPASGGNGASGATAVPAPEQCPKCSGGVYDNRADKAAGRRKPNWPDFKCKDKNCDWAEWIEKPKRRSRSD